MDLKHNGEVIELKDESTSLLDDIFNGQYSPIEIITYDYPEYDKATKILIESESELIKTFNEKQNELYETYHNDMMSKQTSLINRAFAMGVKFGLQMSEELENLPSASRLDR